MNITRSMMITSLHYALDLDHYKLAMRSTEELLDLYNKYCTQQLTHNSQFAIIYTQQSKTGVEYDEF